MWAVQVPYAHLLDVLDLDRAVPLSPRATAGFISRAERSTLQFDQDFLLALKDHLRVRTAELAAAS